EMMRRDKGSKRPPLTPQQRASKPPVSHSIFLTHPITGRKVLYADPGYKWMHRYQKGPLDDRNGCDIADEIEIEVVIEGRIDRGSSIRTKERIAIGRRTDDGLVDPKGTFLNLICCDAQCGPRS